MARKSLMANFTEGSIPKQLFMFTAPLFLSSLLQTFYNMADMIIVGQKLGQIGISSVAIGGDVSHFLLFFSMGFSSAGQIILSQLIGSKQREKVGKCIATMYTSMFALVVMLTVLCLIFRRSILNWMNTPEASFDGALAYSTVCILGLLFVYGYNINSALLRGMGDSRHPFMFVTISTILNILLDVLLVLVLDLGCLGAALATVVSQATSFLLGAVFLYKRRDELNIDFTLTFFLNIDKDLLSKLIKLGIPMAIKSASIQFSKLFVNSWINSYGVSVSAFSGVASKVTNIPSLVTNSCAISGSSMVGQNIGAKNYKRVSKILITILVVVLVTVTVMSALVLAFPQQIYGIFSSEPEILDIAVEYAPIAVLVFFGCACRSPTNALINGSGNHKINFVTAILDGVVLRIGLALLFGLILDFGYLGFWLGDALASFTPAFIGIAFFLSGKWKKSLVD